MKKNQATLMRRGILAAGNFIVDHIKIVDVYPAQEMLCTILSEEKTNGGGPYNLLTDLAHMRVDVPLEALGRLGCDDDGHWIIDDCLRSGIDVTQLHRTEEAPTAYTDVMSVAATGRRTFFHRRGANALLDAKDFDFSRTQARLFHLAYLMLLDQLDADHGAGTAHVLCSAKEHGLITCADTVSIKSPEAPEIVARAAPHLDHLLLNGVEAENILRRSLRDDNQELSLEKLASAVLELLDWGIRTAVVIHHAQGAVAHHHMQGAFRQPAVCVPSGFVRGAVGAGDAFAAGYLWGVHEGLTTDACLEQAAAVAAMSLSATTASGGVKPVETCLAFARDCGFMELSQEQLTR